MSLATVLPAAFTHGALFTNACRLYVPKNGVSAKGIGLVYCAEALGTLLAGVLLTICSSRDYPPLNSPALLPRPIFLRPALYLKASPASYPDT
jgi:hypothetical protein